MKKLFLILAAMLSFGASAAQKQCAVISTACTSGPSTTIINGMEVSRSCWRNTSQYACIEAGVSDTCAPVIAKGCMQSSSACQQGVTINGSFQCITEQREYSCKIAGASSSTIVDCTSQKFCVEGNCFDTGSPPDPDFAKAVTGMEIAREAGVYIDESSFQVFKGQDNRCSKSVQSNCCKGTTKPANGLNNLAIDGGSAYVFDVLGGDGMKSSIVFAFDPTTFALAMSETVVEEMLSCDKEEVLVAVKRGHRLCHYVGEYCSKKVNLQLAKVCTQHKETYCCFNSKISRIINEAARGQIPGLAWGTPESPSCSGLTLVQFQSLDLSEVDFSEFYADIKPKDSNQAEVLNNATNKVHSYFSN